MKKRSTRETLDWFNMLPNKKNRSFLQFDIEAFYPSISKKLLTEVIMWAKEYSYISDCAVNIMNARKIILFDGSEIWLKKEEGGYDVSLGSVDGAECCELVN